MRWQGQERSENVEDRRGMKGTGMAIGGVGGLVLILVAAFFGIDPNKLANLPGVQQGGGQQRELTEEEKRYKEFAEVIMKYTEDVWTEQFDELNEKPYKPARMVLFTDGVRTEGCGTAPSAVGPFYCPADMTVYLDPTFFNDLEKQLGGSKAEFSQAYVVAHEVGHHVQNLLGYNTHVRRQQAGLPKDSEEYNQWSVRLELQADYLAGVWAHHKNKQEKIIEPGDIEAAITTAKSIGDDKIQERSQGFVSPESFTHGSADQRVKWFKRGFQTGDTSQMKLLFDTPFREL